MATIQFQLKATLSRLFQVQRAQKQFTFPFFCATLESYPKLHTLVRLLGCTVANQTCTLAPLPGTQLNELFSQLNLPLILEPLKLTLLKEVYVSACVCECTVSILYLYPHYFTNIFIDLQLPPQPNQVSAAYGNFNGLSTIRIFSTFFGFSLLQKNDSAFCPQYQPRVPQTGCFCVQICGLEQ